MCLAPILMYTQKMCDMSPYHMLVIANQCTCQLLDHVPTVSLPHWEEFQLAAVKGVVSSGGVARIRTATHVR